MPTVSEPTRLPAQKAHSAIELQQVSVRYRVPRERLTSFKEYAIRRLQGRVEYVDLWALSGVNLQVQAGEIFGIVGPNGAGKSTLLKAVARVLDPTRGRVVVRGRVAPLLELGAGFHPELTGRENVFLYGTLLGFTRRDMVGMFDEIVDFAELWDFIDSPVRVYSAGMSSRLGFAVATCRRPDVLLIDEVLAVGDAAFQAKCVQRLEGFRQLGSATLFVSHSHETVVQICGRAGWLSHGTFRSVGDAATVVRSYLESDADQLFDSPFDHPERAGTGVSGDARAIL